MGAKWGVYTVHICLCKKMKKKIKGNKTFHISLNLTFVQNTTRLSVFIDH